MYKNISSIRDGWRDVICKSAISRRIHIVTYFIIGAGDIRATIAGLSARSGISLVNVNF